jgi:hypothetical protein
MCLFVVCRREEEEEGSGDEGYDDEEYDDDEEGEEGEGDSEDVPHSRAGAPVGVTPAAAVASAVRA